MVPPVAGDLGRWRAARDRLGQRPRFLVAVRRGDVLEKAFLVAYRNNLRTDAGLIGRLEASPT